MKNTKYTGDFYTSEAKRHGYRARSVFKLMEIDEKYHIFKKGQQVLDLGSAPGSFLQYISKKVGRHGQVDGYDLKQIEPIDKKNITFTKKDIAYLTDNIPKKEYDVVTADLAPKTSGNNEIDHYHSISLNELAFEIANNNLKKDGYFITKIFEGGDLNELLESQSKHFKKIKLFKPKASKRSRNELFYVGIKK